VGRAGCVRCAGGPSPHLPWRKPTMPPEAAISYSAATVWPRRLALLLVLALGACSSAPPYQRPAMELPATFGEAGLWQPARADAGGAAAVPDAWWRLFNDPELDALQEQVAVGNQSLKASVAQYRAAQAALANSRANLFPTLGVSLDATRSASGRSSNSNSANFNSNSGAAANSFSLTGAASWEVDLWGRLSGAVSASEAQLQASRDDLAAAELSVRATLVQTYFSLRAAEAHAALLQDTLAAYQRSLDLTQNRYQAGVASAADVAQAQNQQKSTEAQLIEAQSSRAQLAHALAVLLGKAPGLFSLPRTALLPEAPEAPTQLPSNLLERRPDIAAAQRTMEAANARIGVARAAMFPALNINAAGGGVGGTMAEVFNWSSRSWVLGALLSLPIIDGGRNKANVTRSEAALEESVAAYRQSVLVAFAEVEDNLAGVRILAEQGVEVDDAVRSARRSAELARKLYDAGRSSYLDLLDAQRNLASVERSAVQLRGNQALTTVALIRALGGGWDAPAPQTMPLAAR
jgi:multidrug efflux system outer membrane protein